MLKQIAERIRIINKVLGNRDLYGEIYDLKIELADQRGHNKSMLRTLRELKTAHELDKETIKNLKINYENPRPTEDNQS